MEWNVPFKVWVLRAVVSPFIAAAWVARFFIGKKRVDRIFDWLRGNGGWGD